MLHVFVICHYSRFVASAIAAFPCPVSALAMALCVCCTFVPAGTEAGTGWNRRARMWLGRGGTWKRGKGVLLLIQKMLKLIINFLTVYIQDVLKLFGLKVSFFTFSGP